MWNKHIYGKTIISHGLKLAMAGWLLLAVAPAWAAAGKILFANGNVKIINAAGQERTAKRGEFLDAGDTIVTSAGSTLQARLEDGGVIAVRPDTRLKIDEFSYKNKDPKQDKALFSLSKGAFRSITGAIAEQNKEAYRINTPSASIGIRGTDHEPLVIPMPLPGETQLGAPGTYDKVNSGSTILQTSTGSLEIRPNQVGFAAGRNLAPTLLPQIPGFFRATATPPAPVASNKPAAGTAPTAPPPPPPGSDPTAAPAPAPEPGSAPPPPAMGPAPVDMLLLSSGTLMPPPTSTTTAPASSPSTLLGGAPAPLGSGGAGADTWMGPFGVDSGSGSIVIDGSPGKTVLVGPQNEMVFVAETNTYGGFQFSRNGAPLLQAGSVVDQAKGISVFWGRWGPGFTVIDQGIVKPSIGNFHYIYSPTLTPATTLSLLASSGFTGTYTFAGGTSPTDHAGNAGVINSASMSVNFGAGQITSYNVNLSIAGNTWNASGTGSLAAFAGNSSSSGIVLTGTCSGACGTTLDTMSRAHGQFVGPKADGALSTFNLITTGATATGALLLKGVP